MSNRIIKATYIGERDKIGICNSFGWGENMAKWGKRILLTAEYLDHGFWVTFKNKGVAPNFQSKQYSLRYSQGSTMSELKGRGICSDSETMTWPWFSWITTPRPALHISLNIAPSKLTFRDFGGGGDHLIHGCMWAAMWEKNVEME